ncbi:MAG TPA: hypothetical protein VLG10_02450 [Methylomirabilota bacterium]|nr:hypothetical protein [Methylomirabilota bacterium]
MRSALRWASLIAAGSILYALGATGLHHRQFDLVLATVLGLAVLIVVIFAATATESAQE